jgi:hypothetical protein
MLSVVVANWETRRMKKEFFYFAIVTKASHIASDCDRQTGLTKSWRTAKLTDFTSYGVVVGLAGPDCGRCDPDVIVSASG